MPCTTFVIGCSQSQLPKVDVHLAAPAAGRDGEHDLETYLQQAQEPVQPMLVGVRDVDEDTLVVLLVLLVDLVDLVEEQLVHVEQARR